MIRHGLPVDWTPYEEGLRRRFTLAAVILSLLLSGCGESSAPGADQKVATAPAPPTPQQALAQLSDPDPAVRAHAFQILAAQQDPNLVLQYLATKHPRERLAPLLDAWGDSAVQTFAQGEPDPKQRAATLAAMAHDSAIDPLIALLGNEDADSRSIAEHALQKKMNAARPKLEAARTDPRFSADTRLGAAMLLCRETPDATTKQCLGPLLGTNLTAIRDPTPAAVAPGAHEYLLAHSREGAAATRADALVLLSAFGAQAFEPLVTVLEQDDPVLRTGAAAGLSHLRDARAVEPLLNELWDLSDAEWMFRENQAFEEDEEGYVEEDADSGVAWPEETELDPSYTQEQHDVLAEAVAQALAAQGGTALKPLLVAEYDGSVNPEDTDRVVENMPRAEVVPALIALLADPGDADRRRVADLLSNTNDPAAVVPLLVALARAPDEDRAYLQNVVQRFHTTAVEPCLPRVNDAAAAVRAACIEVLSKTDPQQHADLIRAALADPDHRVVVAAARGAARLDPASVREPLLQLLERDHPLLRISAAEALARSGNQEAVPALIAAIEKLDYSAAEEEVEIEELPPEEEFLWKDEEEDERLAPHPSSAGTDALIAIGAPAAPAILDALERNPTAPAATRLLHALAGIPAAKEDPRTAAILAAAVEAEDAGRQAAAVHAMAALQPDGWLPVLLRGYERERRKRFGLAADYAVALGNSRDAAVAEALIAGLSGDKDDSEREFVIESLGRNGSPAAREWLNAAIAADDLGTVAAAYEYYIRAGIPGSEEKIVAALEDWVDTDLAVDMLNSMLNSGNEKLSSAAREYAERNHYPIIQQFGSTDTPRWGSLP